MIKRMISLIMLSAMAVGLLSCGNEDIESSQVTDPVTEAPSTPEAQETSETHESAGTQESAHGQESEATQNVHEIEYIRITPQEAEEMMLSEDVIILDVRTEEEFNAGYIPGAILLPSSEVRENAKSVVPDFGAIILVYCRAGSRSEAAARTLIELGYTRVYDFGGINDWHGEIVTP